MTQAETPEFTKHTGTRVPVEAPRVSVVIPNYRSAPHIAETLDSVLAQTFTDYEIIVVNDGSPDTELLREILVPYLDKIIFIDHRENRGAASARNSGIREARGSAIAFVDADDIWLPEYLRTQIDFLEENGFDMVYADCTLFGRTSHEGFDMRVHNPPPGPVTRGQLIAGECHILPSGVLIKKESLAAVNMFDESVPTAEDFDLFMRLMFAGAKIGYQGKCLFRYRIVPTSESADILHRLNRNIYIWRVLQDRLPFTAEENNRIERHVKVEQSALLRAKGRMEILEGNWKKAAEYFSPAKKMAEELGLPFRHKMKLKSVLLMLKVAPNLLRRMMIKARPEEADFLGGRP